MCRREFSVTSGAVYAFHKLVRCTTSPFPRPGPSPLVELSTFFVHLRTIHRIGLFATSFTPPGIKRVSPRCPRAVAAAAAMRRRKGTGDRCGYGRWRSRRHGRGL
ncbi:hypothetical protein ABID25_006200 [Mesorhizobium abyssinicae]